MAMVPNYIFAIVLTIFLVRSYFKFKNSQSANIGVLVVGVIIAIVLLAMSIYGIIFNIPLGEVQHLIENKLS